MRGEILTIGNELVSGRTVDTNSSHITAMLVRAGFDVISITSVGDDREMVSHALRTAVKRSDFIVATGGLGSTDDDLTSEIVAHALGCDLVLDRESLDKIKTRLERTNRPFLRSFEKMAWIPDGATILDNRTMSCGFYIKKDGVHLFFLPGVPEQAMTLMKRSVIPMLQQFAAHIPYTGYRVLKLYGISEPEIAERFGILRDKVGDAEIGFYPRFPENHITITLKGPDRDLVEKELDRIEGDMISLFGNKIFSRDESSMEEVVGRLLLKEEMTLSVAESCTGGMIGSRLTNVPGSSRYFLGGVVVYSNESKVRLIGVSPGTLERYGAVSNQTAEEMAVGVRKAVGSDISVSVTGIAGPDGGSKEKPVGTVHLGLSCGDDLLSGRYLFQGDRTRVRQNAATMALDWVRRYINGDSFIPGI